MANGKISGMTPAGALAAADLLEISQTAGGPTTKSITGANIQTLAWTSPNVTGTLTVATNTVINGTSLSTINAAGTSTSFTLQGQSATQCVIERNSSDSSAPTFYMGKTRGTIASPASVVLGDSLGSLSFFAQAGGSASTVAQVVCNVIETGTISSSVCGTSIDFTVCPIGSASLITALHTTAYNITVQALITTTPISSVPSSAAPVAGSRAFTTTGSTSVSFGATTALTGGSSVGPVYYDGTNWRWG